MPGQDAHYGPGDYEGSLRLQSHLVPPPCRRFLLHGRRQREMLSYDIANTPAGSTTLLKHWPPATAAKLFPASDE
ncbi:MAG: hypothetical protein R3C49_02980 [Planctomycetaceae bacterium]